MKEQFTAYPTNWVSKNDLLLSRPDLADHIQNLTESDMQTIAKMIGDAVADTQHMAIDELLAKYFQKSTKDTQDTSLGTGDENNFPDKEESS